MADEGVGDPKPPYELGVEGKLDELELGVAPAADDSPVFFRREGIAIDEDIMV
jgi:hypothetical protein